MDEGSALERIYATCDQCAQLGLRQGACEYPSSPGLLLLAFHHRF